MAKRKVADLELVERWVGDQPPVVMVPELAYSYSRIGRPEEARRYFEMIEALDRSPGVGAGTWAMAYLAIGDEARALQWLEAAAEKARRHEVDPAFLNLMNLKMNFLGDSRLSAPPFDEVLSRIRGD